VKDQESQVSHPHIFQKRKCMGNGGAPFGEESDLSEKRPFIPVLWAGMNGLFFAGLPGVELMPTDSQWIKADVTVTETTDGSLILQNKIPLADYPANLLTWLHQNAARFPDKPFLQERDEQNQWCGLTYAETLAAVNRLSNGLVAMGLTDDRPIAILSENCVDMALIQFAAMQVGLPVTPISYAYSVRSQTGSLIKHILDVTQASMLVMSNADVHMAKINQWDIGGLQLYAFLNSESHANVHPFNALFAEETSLSAESQARFEDVTADTLAKIQFTSGSTDLPKGVEVTHKMMVTNQVAIAQVWPFLDSDEVVVDWLPWNHTFGGNLITNMVLRLGGTFYIDRGNPTPMGLPTTVQNIKDVSPTIYFGVPRSYTALYAKMKEDEGLKEAFFRRLKFVFTAAAALDQATYEGIKAMSAEVRGETVPFFSAWGATETAPGATHVYWDMDDVRVIGVPLPGVSIKLAPDPCGKREMRVKGPNVTRGYYNNPIATAAAFDEEGYYRTGDAGRFLEPGNPAAGLVFDGRTGEDFKLTSGVWVHNGRLRNSINQLGQPCLLEVVIAAPNREYLGALVFPNLPVLRERFAEASESLPEDAGFLKSEPVVEFFRSVFKQHNATQSGSSGRFERFILPKIPPRLDKNETTDKGYINQSAVLTHRADIFERLYAEPPPDEVIIIG
jgi:feruloyl-CoA synthase